MIIINFLMDMIICNLTIFPTYFFLTNLNIISKRYILVLISLLIFIDLFITSTWFLNLILVILLYFFQKYFLKKNNLVKNILINSFSYVIYIIALYLYFNIKSIDCLYLLKYIVLNYPLFLIYLLISYKILKQT